MPCLPSTESRPWPPSTREWKEQQPFKGILEGDWIAALAGYKHSGIELLTASHSGMTTEEFETEVNYFLKTAKHPRFQRLYTDLVYQPMLEVLEYLRANGFKNYIVSGGDVEFMKPLASRVLPHPAGASDRQLRQDQVRDAATASRFRSGYRISTSSTKGRARPAAIKEYIGSPADDGVWQLRRRPGNVAVDNRRPWAEVRPDHPPHGRGSGVGLRQPIACRKTRQGT